MRRLLLLLLVLTACSQEKEGKAPGPVVAEAPRPAAEVEQSVAEARAAHEASPAPASTLTPPAAEQRIAVRSYEHLLNGRRAATMRVEWKSVERDGRKLVEDVTQTVSREERDMAGYYDAFDQEQTTRTLRTEEGELVSMETETKMPGRVDRTWTERTATGYKVRRLAGTSEESFEVATEGPVMLDAEAFLGSRIRAGKATPGATFEMPVLAGKRVVTSTLRVIGPDGEGPGLKVVETTEGNDTLWWFAEDGSVVRLRAGIRVIRRDDTVQLGDLPGRPARYQITLPANVDLPRIFTAKQMLVDVIVQTDETTKPPLIPESAFTEVEKRAADRVTLLLKSDDDPEATCPLPIDPKGFEEFLKPTALMEVDDPEVRRTAARAVGDATDAREAARRICDFVFQSLRKVSSPLAQPTVKQILRDRCGDCSEHALLFTGLCRAAGIPVRQCSGYVCIGGDWGGHSWCEVWVGKWIGADPTTNEIGTRARYVLLARPDEPVEAGRITPERTTIVIRRAEYVDGTLDLENPDPDPVLFSGIRLGSIPDGWEVKCSQHVTLIRGPDFTAMAKIEPDHGYRSMRWLLRRLGGGTEGAFGGKQAAVAREGPRWVVSLGREILEIHVQMRPGASTSPEEALVKALAPTLERAE